MTHVTEFCSKKQNRKKDRQMGQLWSRCCDCNEDDAAVSPNHESLLLVESFGEIGSDSPEEERGMRRNGNGSTGINKSPALSSMPINLPRIRPASFEEEREYMVRSYSSGALQEAQPECLLCMENFTPTRPTTLSLCACGVNRNTFHLECLLKWRKKSNKTNCPVCDNELFFETPSSSNHETCETLSSQGSTE